MSILRINIVFFGQNMAAFTASLDILNTKRLISPEREGEAQILPGLYREYIC